MSIGRVAAPAALAAEPFYRAHPLTRLHWAQWEGQCVVFDECSGQTFRMDALRALVLNQLVVAPTQRSELRRELADALLVPDERVMDATLVTILDELQRMGLVEQVGP